MEVYYEKFYDEYHGGSAGFCSQRMLFYGKLPESKSGGEMLQKGLSRCKKMYNALCQSKKVSVYW
jgi:hypothetical protein